MPIIIPSKSVYEVNHKIIKNNEIGKIEVNATDVKFPKEFDSVVYNEDILDNADHAVYPKTNNASTENYDSSLGTYTEVDNIINASLDIITKTINIPKTQFDKTITNIYNRFSSDDKSGVYYTVYYQKKTYDVTAKMDVEIINPYGNYFRPAPENAIPYDIIKSNEKIDSKVFSDHIITEDAEYNQTVEFSHKLSYKSNVGNRYEYEPNASVTYSGSQYIKELNLVENEDNYLLTLRVLCSYDYNYLEYIYDNYGDFYNDDIYDSTTQKPRTRNLTGKGEIIIPQSVQISAYGDYITIDLQNDVVIIGDKYPSFSITNNELLQTTNFYLSGDTKNALQFDYSKLLEQYKNGKEVATVRCSISDYYDTSENKVIDIKNSDKMCFEIGDDVIPYIYTANGTDKPLSVDKIGNAKTFTVIGVKTYFNGAVWQTLTLLEKD